jgi:hypothetical protein
VDAPQEQHSVKIIILFNVTINCVWGRTMLDMAPAAPRPQRPQRPFGRSLADFRVEGWDTPHGLLPLEESLLQSVGRGESCRAAGGFPEKENDANCVRGAFLRFLLLGGDDDAPVHEKGVELWEAFVDGDVDLENAKAARPLLLLKCNVRGGLIGVNSQLGLLVLSGSRIQDILCDGAHVAGRVFLRNGFTANGEVRFPGAEIGGLLDCDGGTFKNQEGLALNCEGATIASNVLLRDGFRAAGEVGFVGARIGGSLDCRKGKFRSRGVALNLERASIAGAVMLRDGFAAEGETRFSSARIGGRFTCNDGSFVNASGDALMCDRLEVADSVFLNDGFIAQGAVRFVGATVGGDFLCSGGKFETEKAVVRSTGSKSFAAAYALSLANARIEGTLWLGPAAPPYNQHVTILGSLNLAGTQARSFVDHPDSWPSPHIITEEHGGIPCYLDIDGFTYSQFASGAPTNARTRRRWLLRQPPDHLDKDFRMQPFAQLARTLRETGHVRDAGDIDYFKKTYLLRRAWRLRNRRNPFSMLSWVVQWALLEQGLGYGRRPHRMIIAAFAVFSVCSMIFAEASRQGLFAPSSPHIFMDAKLRSSCSPPGGRPAWTSSFCELNKAPEHTAFNAYIYSLDLMLPVINLGQKGEWRPVSAPLQFQTFGMKFKLPRGFIRGLVWFETLFAWVWSLSLSAVATGVVRRE